MDQSTSREGEEIRIVFLDGESLPPGVALKTPAFPHRMTLYPSTAREEVASRIAEADIVISNKVPITASDLAGAPDVRMIAVSATGTDMVDLKACAERGITVSNVRDYATNAVPEHVFALIFALRKNLLAYRQSVAGGRWQESDQFCFFDHGIEDLASSTLGVIGAGTLGQAVARIGSALGMNVLLADRKGEAVPRVGRVPFDQVLAESDVITLHLPLNEATRGLIGRPELALMRRRPILINAARGGLVDEEALGEALASGQISGAGFDVASAEPPPSDHALMDLLKYQNFILTPHVAWASRQAAQALADQTVGNIEAFVAGRPRNVVSASN